MPRAVARSRVRHACRRPTSRLALACAQKKGHLDAAEMFITSAARCADELGDASLLNQVLDSTDSDGNTALHWVARKGAPPHGAAERAHDVAVAQRGVSTSSHRTG